MSATEAIDGAVGLGDPDAGYRPVRWLGGPSAFGLSLPDAAPTPSTMYAPRGVCLTDEAVIVADTGNHRLLVWSDPLPDADHRDADVVIGQPDMVSEGPKLLFLPTGVLVDEGRLVVADAWHHRILVWDDVSTAGSSEPSVVLGQPPSDLLPNHRMVRQIAIRRACRCNRPHPVRRGNKQCC